VGRDDVHQHHLLHAAAADHVSAATVGYPLPVPVSGFGSVGLHVRTSNPTELNP
jgi:hypothetical protein